MVRQSEWQSVILARAPQIHTPLANDSIHVHPHSLSARPVITATIPEWTRPEATRWTPQGVPRSASGQSRRSRSLSFRHPANLASSQAREMASGAVNSSAQNLLALLIGPPMWQYQCHCPLAHRLRKSVTCRPMDSANSHAAVMSPGQSGTIAPGGSTRYLAAGAHVGEFPRSVTCGSSRKAPTH